MPGFALSVHSTRFVKTALGCMNVPATHTSSGRLHLPAYTCQPHTPAASSLAEGGL